MRKNEWLPTFCEAKTNLKFSKVNSLQKEFFAYQLSQIVFTSFNPYFLLIMSSSLEYRDRERQKKQEVGSKQAKLNLKELEREGKTALTSYGRGSLKWIEKGRILTSNGRGIEKRGHHFTDKQCGKKQQRETAINKHRTNEDKLEGGRGE